ncbi:MAG: ASCH domain-containing protein [Aggregatilineales bacterium]
MIFAYTLQQVLSGDKRQTRRLIKPGQQLAEDGRAILNGQRAVYQVGRTYAVQPSGRQKAVARIVLTGLRKERVSAISEADARAEGFPSREAFLAMWRVIHGEDADLNCDVWVFEFELAR